MEKPLLNIHDVFVMPDDSVNPHRQRQLKPDYVQQGRADAPEQTRHVIVRKPSLQARIDRHRAWLKAKGREQ